MPPNPHPLVVHFTIALFSISVLCDVLGWLLRKESLHTVGGWNLIFGFFGAIVTVATGLFAERSVGHNNAAHAIMETHKTFGLIVLGLMAALFLWRIFRRGQIPQKLLPVYLLIAIAGVSAMTVGAYYGGELVYTHGVAVRAMPKTIDHTHESNGHHNHAAPPPDLSVINEKTQHEAMNGGHVITRMDSIIRRCDILTNSIDKGSMGDIDSVMRGLADSMKSMAQSMKAMMKNLAAIILDKNTMKDQTMAEHFKILQKHLAEMAQEMEGATQQLQKMHEELKETL